jgi:rhamnogalacturonyl hydrolase YesR
MHAATGDLKYIDYLDQEWANTSARLYDTTEHLYARDPTHLARTEANGKTMFWSRSSGWVMGSWTASSRRALNRRLTKQLQATHMGLEHSC